MAALAHVAPPTVSLAQRPKKGVASSTEAAWIRAARPMIERMASRFAGRLPPSLGTEDLVSVGYVALLEMKRRNPALTLDDLERLGACRARGAMLDEMRQADPLSRRTRQRARAIERITAAFEARAGRARTDAELATALGTSRATTAASRRAAHVTVGLASHGDAVDQLPAVGEPSPEDMTHRCQRLARCRKAVSTLPDRQRRIVGLYFGDEQTLRQIGEHLGVTEARVSQVLSGTVRQLRQVCASLPPPAA